MGKVRVLKFGGNSVGNGARSSAMAGVTDALLAIALLSCTRKGEAVLLLRYYQERPYSADASPVAAWGVRLSACLLARVYMFLGGW